MGGWGRIVLQGMEISSVQLARGADLSRAVRCSGLHSVVRSERKTHRPPRDEKSPGNLDAHEILWQKLSVAPTPRAAMREGCTCTRRAAAILPRDRSEQFTSAPYLPRDISAERSELIYSRRGTGSPSQVMTPSDIPDYFGALSQIQIVQKL